MTFNEGVTLSVAAGNEEHDGRQQNADSLNNLAIAKFRETYQLDSLHPIVRSALAHSYYMARSYREAIDWFRRANKFSGPVAASYREMGLCQVNIGMLPEGKLTIDTALMLDTSAENRKIVVQDLSSVANVAWKDAEGYHKQGDPQKGNEYRKNSVAIGIMAFRYDTTNKPLASVIAERANVIGDTALSREYASWPAH